jgi:hypothetical protein
MKRCTTKWRVLSPGAQVIVDPVSNARGVIRDTRVEGAYRFHWSVIPSEESLPIAAGRTGELVRARAIAEEALRACIADRRDLAGRVAMPDGPLPAPSDLCSDGLQDR